MQAVQPANTWAISARGSSCDAACEAQQGMGCSLEEMQGVANATGVITVLGGAVPGLACSASITSGTDIAPAFDVSTDACAPDGTSSTCNAAPQVPTQQRLWWVIYTIKSKAGQAVA